MTMVYFLLRKHTIRINETTQLTLAFSEGPWSVEVRRDLSLDLLKTVGPTENNAVFNSLGVKDTSSFRSDTSCSSFSTFLTVSSVTATGERGEGLPLNHRRDPCVTSILFFRCVGRRSASKVPTKVRTGVLCFVFPERKFFLSTAISILLIFLG